MRTKEAKCNKVSVRKFFAIERVTKKKKKKNRLAISVNINRTTFKIIAFDVELLK